MVLVLTSSYFGLSVDVLIFQNCFVGFFKDLVTYSSNFLAELLVIVS